ncbi:MAG TPA: secondary thiamine-phosphate synthase enzyme YjbQ [Chloroflexota bacterium]|nr:secondary thiamine-phosphate synthase enzyme YjbQ [Chloroflexota bacterium]
MISSHRLTYQTRGRNDVIDVTRDVANTVRSAGIRGGIVTVFVPGSTAALTTVEYEPGLVQDLRDFFDRIAPESQPYRHNLTEGDANGHSHVRASLLGPSVTVPVEDGRMALGVWQQIVLVDFDVRPRSRELVVQILGE